MMKPDLPASSPLLKFGVQYYPEHWPEERWAVDARLMREAGVNTVRMGEFAWSSYEERSGQLEMDWMERAIDLLGAHGIGTILCTCSRTPPLWLYHECPDIIAVDRDGRAKPTDHRYHVGLAHEAFIQQAKRIDERVIRRFAGNSHVVAWQVDNEVGYNDCYCGQCLQQFHRFLKEKYGNIGNLNAAWGQHFWSCRIDRFEEVPMPQSHPQALLEYRRFMSHVNIGFCRWRAELMRQLDPGKPVTTNFQNLYLAHTDYHEMGKVLDVNGMNNYPARTPGLAIDFYRGARKSVWVLEQQTHLPKEESPPGLMRLRAWLAIAQGADALIFFRWRQCRWGKEQFGDGILPHSGEVNRLYGELAGMGGKIGRLGDRIAATKPSAEVAIVYSYEARWAVDVAGYTDPLDPVHEAVGFHRQFQRHVSCIDAMDPREPLDSYKLVVAPRLWLVDAAVAENLRAYVAGGGLLCLTAGSGVVDTNGKSFAEPRPGPLRDLAGIEVSDLACQDGLEVALESELIPGLNGLCGHHVFDEIHTKGADVLATYGAGWRKGLPAITRIRCGSGSVITVGTRLGDDGMQALVDWLCREVPLEIRSPTPGQVLVRERVGDSERLLFLMNFSQSSQCLSPHPGWVDAFDGVCREQIEIPPMDLRILSRSAG